MRGCCHGTLSTLSSDRPVFFSKTVICLQKKIRWAHLLLFWLYDRTLDRCIFFLPNYSEAYLICYLTQPIEFFNSCSILESKKHKLKDELMSRPCENCLAQFCNSALLKALKINLFSSEKSKWSSFQNFRSAKFR